MLTVAGILELALPGAKSVVFSFQGIEKLQPSTKSVPKQKSFKGFEPFSNEMA